MNCYGKVSGPQHTIFGRIVPMMEAMRLAVRRAAGQPIPAAQLSKDLPPWVHRIADELTCTVFKGIVWLAPAGNKYHARKTGQTVGLLIRMGVFYWQQAPAILEREGLNKLTPEQEKKLENITGWKQICEYTSKESGRIITTKAQAQRYLFQRLSGFVWRTVWMTWTLTKFALCQPVGDAGEFLGGLAEGFKCFLDKDGEFAKAGKRTEIYMALLTYWPEIQEMQRAEPPLSRPYLLKWLEEQEGKKLAESDKIFCELCHDIGLDMAAPGHPFKVEPPK